MIKKYKCVYGFGKILKKIKKSINNRRISFQINDLLYNIKNDIWKQIYFSTTLNIYELVINEECNYKYQFLHYESNGFDFIEYKIFKNQIEYHNYRCFKSDNLSENTQKFYKLLYAIKESSQRNI